MPKSYSTLENYDRCQVCGYDHDYEFHPALEKHKALILEAGRSRTVRNEDKIQLVFDPIAYAYAAVSGCILLVVVILFLLILEKR